MCLKHLGNYVAHPNSKSEIEAGINNINKTIKTVKKSIETNSVSEINLNNENLLIDSSLKTQTKNILNKLVDEILEDFKDVAFDKNAGLNYILDYIFKNKSQNIIKKDSAFPRVANIQINNIINDDKDFDEFYLNNNLNEDDEDNIMNNPNEILIKIKEYENLINEKVKKFDNYEIESNSKIENEIKSEVKSLKRVDYITFPLFLDKFENKINIKFTDVERKAYLLSIFGKEYLKNDSLMKKKEKLKNELKQFIKFRVIRINNDGTIKAISEDISATYMWGDKDNYKDSILNKWLDYNELYYVGVYYNTLPNPSNYLVKTKYTEDVLNASKVKEGKDKYESYVTTLGIKDYSNADGKNSFINIGKSFWIIGHDKDNSNLYVDTDGSINTTTTYESYGVRAVITFKKNVEVTGGNGSVDEPFVINLGNDANKVGSYVKLGDDVWKVYFENKDTLRLHLDKILYTSSYSDSGSLYDPVERGSLAAKLNGEFINSKSYKNVVIKDYYYMTTTSTVCSMIFVNHNSGVLEDASVEDQKGVVPVITIKKASIKGGNGTKDNPYTV